MLAFQLGMFAFWATVATAPRVFLDRCGPGRHARRRIVRFSIPYFALVYGVGLSVPEHRRFAALIPLIIGGYSVVAGFLVRHVIDSYPPRARGRIGDAGPGPPTARPPAERRPSAGRGWPRDNKSELSPGSTMT
jgi:hypothetical protein